MLFKNILWDYLGRFSLLFANLAIMAVLSRVLTPDDFGAVGIILAISGLATVMLEFGFPSAIIQQKEISIAQLSTIFWGALGVSLLLYACVFMAAPWVAAYYGLPDLKGLLRTAGLAFLINALNLVPNALIIKNMRFKEQSVRNVVITLCIGALAIFWAFRGWGAWALAWQNVLTIFCTMLVNLWLTRWRPAFIFEANAVREMFHYSKYLFLSGVLENIFTRVDALLIGKIMNLQNVGFYTRAKSMETMVQGVMTNSLNAVIFPYFAGIQEDTEKTKQQFDRFYRLLCMAIFLFAGLAYLNAPWLFRFLFGPQWDISAVYYRILAFGAFAYPLSALMLNIINARGNSRDFFKAELLKKMVYLPAFLLLWHSIEAFLTAWVIGLSIGFVINLVFLQRTLPVDIWKYFWMAMRYFVLLASFLTFAHLFFAFTDCNAMHILPVLSLSVVYVLIFAVLIFLPKKHD